MRLMRLDSISKKFLVPTLALTIVLLGGLGSFIAVNNNASIRSMIESKGNSSADFMNKISTTYYSNFDFLSVEELVKEITKDPEVAFAVFYDDQNKPLTKTSVEPKDTSSLIIFERAIKAENGTQLGALKLGYNKKNLSKNLQNSLFIVGAGTVVAILLLAIGISYLVNSIIIERMAQTMNVIKEVARGDLTKDLSGMVDPKTTDEIAELGGATNTMVENLKGMLGNVLDVTSSIGTSSTEVKQATGNITTGSRTQSESVEEAASSINEMHSSLKEIGGTVQDLFKTSETTSSSVVEMAASIDEVARTMANLSSSIEETSAAIAQMSAAVHQIAEHVEVLSSAAEETAATSSEISASVREVESNAKESASLAEAVAADAQQLGISSIEKTIEGMGRIESTARRTADVVNSLGKRAENVGSILTVIEEITDQTGLLALNAAILAAQAGEQGKGFAVVAAEIRELANRTEASTKEISTLISSVQAESREAVVVMREEISIVEEGVKLARNAGEALQKILERADKSRDMSRRISQAAAEQNRGIRQVNEAVVKISEMSHQIAQATKEQKNGSEQIARASEKMRELTRFVKTSTDEQAKGGKDISVAVENITGKIGMVNRAAGEVQSGSDLIVRAIERIKEIARSNTDMAAGLDTAMDVMVVQSETLKKEIEKFRMNGKADQRLLESVRDAGTHPVS